MRALSADPFTRARASANAHEIRFGTVFKATLRGEHEVAVKTMRVAKITERELSKFKAELIIMAPLHHQNLVHLWGGVWNEGTSAGTLAVECDGDGDRPVFCPRRNSH